MSLVISRILTTTCPTVSQEPTSPDNFKEICAETGLTARCCTVDLVSVDTSSQGVLVDRLTLAIGWSRPPLRHAGWPLRVPLETTATGNFGVIGCRDIV